MISTCSFFILVQNDAPKHSDNFEEFKKEVLEYIKGKMRGSLPFTSSDEFNVVINPDEKEINDLVIRCQYHQHRCNCNKKNKKDCK